MKLLKGCYIQENHPFSGISWSLIFPELSLWHHFPLNSSENSPVQVFFSFCCAPSKSTLQILTLTLLRDQGYPAGPRGSHVTRAVSLGLVTSGTDRVIKVLWWRPVKEQEDLISIHTRVRVMGKHTVELTNHGPTVQQMLGLLIMQVRVHWIWGLTYRSGWQ